MLPISLSPLGPVTHSGTLNSSLAPDHWGLNEYTTNGLTLGYVGGPALNGPSVTLLPDGTVTLADNATNYVERTDDGAVSVNQVGFTAGRHQMFVVTTVAGLITSHVDWRGGEPVAAAALAQEAADRVAADDALSARVDNTTSSIATLTAGQTAGLLGFATLADLAADLAHADGTLAIVTNDPTPDNNTTYRKSGGSGAGSWIAAVDRVTAVESRATAIEAKTNPIDATGRTILTSEYVYAIVGALRRIAFGIRTDGSIDAVLSGLAVAGGYTVTSFDASGEYVYAITDAAGRIAFGIKADGTIDAKIGDQAEVVTARGTRPSLDTRLSQALSGYGLPIRYVWGEWYLRETRQRLRKRLLAESTQLIVATIGDSWTQLSARWTAAIATTLKGQFGDAGPGWVGFGYGGAGYTLKNGNVSDTDVTLTFTGAWTAHYATSVSPDICDVHSTTVGDQITVAWTPAGTISAVTLYYLKGAGSIQYRWNGGAWTPLDLSAGAGLGTVVLAGLPAGAWTLDLQVVSGDCTLCGLDVQQTADGVRVHKLGATGSAAIQWQAVNAAQWEAGLSALAPNLVTILLATNDQPIYDAATFSGYVQTMITRVKAAVPTADILLIAPCENGRGEPNPMSTYADALAQLAAVNHCAFLDLQYAFGDVYADYGFGSARNWFASDTIHPDPATGGRAIVDAVTRLLTQL